MHVCACIFISIDRINLWLSGTQVSTICMWQRHSFVVKCGNTWKSTHPLFSYSCKVLQPWTPCCETTVNVEILRWMNFHVLWVILHLWNYKPHKIDHPWVRYACSVCTHYHMQIEKIKTTKTNNHRKILMYIVLSCNRMLVYIQKSLINVFLPIYQVLTALLGRSKKGVRWLSLTI